MLRKYLKMDWPYLWGGVAIALVNTLVLLINGKPWGITTSLTLATANLAEKLYPAIGQWPYFADSVRYNAFQQGWFYEYDLLILLGLLLGVLLSSLSAGEFRWKPIRSKKQILLAVSGGFIMGYGTRLASGCNVGSFVSSISSLSLQGWVFGVASFLGAYLGIKLLVKYM